MPIDTIRNLRKSNTMDNEQKHERGQRMWRMEILRNGFYNLRECQNSEGQASSEVIPSIPIHFEVRFDDELNISDAMEQAKQAVVDNGDSDKIPAVAHKKSREEWSVTISANDFFRILRQEVDIDIGA